MTIRTKQDEIFDLRVTTFLRSINDVVKSRLPFIRNFQTHCKRFARRSTSIRLFFWQIAKRITALVHLLACTLGDVFLYILVVALFLGREVAIRLAFFEQAVRGSTMCGGI